MGNKRYAVLLCAQDPEYVENKYGGYTGVFTSLLRDEGEIWDAFRVSGEFPEEDQLERYDGFVITGSACDAHGNDIWICRLVELLKKIDSMKKKILGICFGHQILARALGGKTGRSLTGWDIGVRSMNLFSASFEFFKPLKLPPNLAVLEFHQDEVKALPASAEVLAWSPKTGIEMYRNGDHILGIQGHPEYAKDIVKHLMNRALNRNCIQEHHIKVATRRIESRDPDREAWKRLCKNFLKANNS